MVPASIPSPSQAVWYLGPVPLRAYALAIILGIVIAWWWMDRRYRAKGGPAEVTVDIAMWAVLFGIVGGRLYHVITDYQLYFGPGRNPVRALYIWEGGLGIWGAVLLGGIGVYLTAHRQGLRLLPIADSLAPALLVAQAIGRFGNYFNQELFGGPTDLPWGLEIDAAHLPEGYPVGTTFHPTFLYEALWCLAGAALLVALERKFRLYGGQLFAAYGIVYTAGRVWIEALRIDDAHHILGLRLNVWTSIILFLVSVAAFVVLRRRYLAHPEVDDIWLSAEAEEKYKTTGQSSKEGVSVSGKATPTSASSAEDPAEVDET
ncbi:prolipoprotein diacylglyceryl transferase [Actinomycetaceae bacterium L2_0104]